VPVFGNVPPIIEINEIAVGDLPEGHEGGDGEEEGDDKQVFLWWQEWFLWMDGG